MEQFINGMISDMEEQRKTKKIRKKRYISTGFYWLLLLLASVGVVIALFRLPMIPGKWKWLLALGVAILACLGLLITLHYGKRNILVKLYNILFTILFALGSILMPYVTDKVTDLFNGAGSVIKVNCYVLKDSYKENNPGNWNTSINDDTQITDLQDAVFITSSGTDAAIQVYAQKYLKEAIGTSSLQVMDRQKLPDAVEALYSGEGDVLIVGSSYESMITDIAEYDNFRSETKILYTIEMPVENTIKGDTALTKEPFSIFFGGNDEEGDLTLYGRTDVDMIVTVNPNSHQIVMVSFPRDSYVENPAFNNDYDKLTHLALSGLDNTITSLNHLMDMEINNYVLVNYTTFRTIIDALGGIDVDNPYAFEADDGEYFEEGTIHLAGDPALMYVRERNHLPDGDFGRSMHQQLVMKAIIRKITSPNVIVHFNNLLTSLNGTFLTNVSSDALYSLVAKQLDENISWNIVNYHLTGDVGYGACAAAYYEELSVVYPYPDQIDFVSDVIAKVYNGDIIEQEELPEGSFDTIEEEE